MRRLLILIVATGILLGVQLTSASATSTEPTMSFSPLQGKKVDGWYIENPYSVLHWDCDGDGSQAPRVSDYGVGWLGGDGVFHVKIVRTGAVQVTNYINGALAPNAGDHGVVTLCGSYSGPSGTYNDVLLDEDWKGDSSPPIISNVPATFSSTSDGTKTISASVTDRLSGVASVKINGLTPSKSGNTYSANVPLDYGENTITVVATDVVGNTSRVSGQIYRREVFPTVVPTQSSTQQASPETTASASQTPALTPIESPSSVATQTPSATPTADGLAVGASRNGDHQSATFGWIVILAIAASGASAGAVKMYFLLRKQKKIAP